MKRVEARRHGLALAVLLVTAVALLLVCRQALLAETGGVLTAPLDDAWIHFQFARNLSQGNGFSFNPGQPTPGSTAPLWTVLLAGVGLFTDRFMAAAMLLSAGFFLLTVGLTYGFTWSLFRRHWVAFLAALGVALTGRFLWAGLAVMETTAFAALSLAAVWAFSRWGLRPFPALLFGLAGQLRPEGHALFALAFLLTGIQWLRTRQASDSATTAGLQPLISSLFVYGLVAAPYALFSLATTGKPLPNTFYAKVGTEHLFSWRTLRETLLLHWQDNPASLLLLPLGVVPLWKRSRLALAWLLGLPLFTAVIVDFVWHHGRYTMPLIPFQMAAAAVGAAWLADRVETSKWVRRGITAVFILVLAVAGVWRLPQWATMLGNNAREVLEIDVALGHWLAENTPAHALIAVDDIGAITFISQREIVDLNGLVSPEMWPAVRQPIGLPRNQVATRILSQSRPAYMVGFALWHWELATTPAVAEPIHRVTTGTHTMIAEPEAAVYRMTWPYRETADPQTAHDALLAGAIRLLGHDLTPPAAGEPLALVLFWQSMAPVTADYDVFVHVLSPAGEIVAQADRQPVSGLAATSVWQPGDIIRDPYAILLPADLAAGVYQVRAGMYLRQTGARLSATGPDSLGDAVDIGDLEISD